MRQSRKSYRIQQTWPQTLSSKIGSTTTTKAKNKHRRTYKEDPQERANSTTNSQSLIVQKKKHLKWESYPPNLKPLKVPNAYR